MLNEPRRDPLGVEPIAAMARAAASEGFALAHEHGFGLDEIDHEILVDALKDATESLTALVWAMHPELDDLQEGEVDIAIDDLTRRRRSAHVERTPHAHLRELLQASITNVEAMRERAVRHPKRPSRLIGELDACMWHLATALYFLDPDGLAGLMFDRPMLRTMLGYAEKLLDTAIAEQRIAVQARHDDT